MKAHKVVLSACSPFFESIFVENPCKHPVVILKDIRYVDLKALVEFMYKGEVNVVQEQLPSLLKTAEALKIKGLAEVTGDSKDDHRPSADVTPRPESPGAARRKRQRARRKSTDSGDAHSDSEESLPKTSRTNQSAAASSAADHHDESSMDGASSRDDGSQASVSVKEATTPVAPSAAAGRGVSSVDTTSSSTPKPQPTPSKPATANGQAKEGGQEFEPSRLLEASMAADDSNDHLDMDRNSTGPDNHLDTTGNDDVKPILGLDEGATPTGAIVPAGQLPPDALSLLLPQSGGNPTAAALAAAAAGTSFQNSPQSHGTYRAATPARAPSWRSAAAQKPDVGPLGCWALARAVGVG